MTPTAPAPPVTYLPMLATWITFLMALAPLLAAADTLYLCKSYGGGMFWSNSHCRQHNALIDRMESVPSGLPFDQQVEIARSQSDAAQSLYPAPAPAQPAAPQAQPRTPRETYQGPCEALDQRVVHLDAMARQPQSGRKQDWISAERKKARDEQFRLRCR